MSRKPTKKPRPSGLSRSRKAGESAKPRQKKSDSAPPRQQQHFRLLLESAGAVIIGLSRDYRILEWNREAERFFGWRRDEVLGKDYIETCLPEADRGKVLTELGKVLLGKESLGFEKKIKTRGGEERTLSWSATRCLDFKREAIGILAIGQDITPRKTYQTLVEESQAHLAGIIRSAMDAIITVDDEQHITIFNGAAELMFRCSAAEAIGQPLDRFIPERFRPAHREHIQVFGKTSLSSRSMGKLGTIFGMRADGQEFPIEASISQVDVKGKKSFTVILRDISERLEAEERATSFGRILEESRNEIYVFDEKTLRFLLVNRGARENLGYSMEELRNMTPLDFKPEFTPDTFADLLRPLRTGEQPKVQFETVHLRKDKSVYPVNVHLQLSTWAFGKAFVAIILDITRRKQTEEELRQVERLAEMGTLASGMAHEIGTPMNVILGRAEYILGKTQEDGTRKGLQTIVAQVERITKIMNQLLAFARRRRGEPQPVDLRRSIEDSLEVLHERLARHRIQVEKTFDALATTVLVDPDHMTQVCLNLFINAIHAMSQGGTLRIGLGCTKDSVRMTVADTGHGIPKEDLKKIFTPFFTTKEVGKGTGLGLTVVHGIIQEHGGSIVVDSEPGQGTTFAIMLPVPSS